MKSAAFSAADFGLKQRRDSRRYGAIRTPLAAIERIRREGIDWL
jgi:hypothetical protein